MLRRSRSRAVTAALRCFVLLKMTETLKLRGTLCGHNGWVTQIATNPKYPDMILSSSRGKLKLF